MVKSEETPAGEMGRLYWRSRRGMQELEWTLLPFVKQVVPTLGEAGVAAYRELLECEDWEIFDWLQDRAKPPEALRGIVAELRDFAARR